MIRSYVFIIILGMIDMARPIAETPVLYGEDAQRFEIIIKNTKPYTEEKKQQLRETYENFKRKVKILI